MGKQEAWSNMNMTITPFRSFFYFIWKSDSFWTYILFGLDKPEVTTGGVKTAAHPNIGFVLSVWLQITGQCDKSQLPENRIFADKVDLYPDFSKRFFPPFRREVRRTFPRRPSSSPWRPSSLPWVAVIIGSDDRLHGDEVNVHGNEDGRHGEKPANKWKKSVLSSMKRHFDFFIVKLR